MPILLSKVQESHNLCLKSKEKGRAEDEEGEYVKLRMHKRNIGYHLFYKFIKI